MEMEAFASFLQGCTFLWPRVQSKVVLSRASLIKYRGKNTVKKDATTFRDTSN